MWVLTRSLSQCMSLHVIAFQQKTQTAVFQPLSTSFFQKKHPEASKGPSYAFAIQENALEAPA